MRIIAVSLLAFAAAPAFAQGNMAPQRAIEALPSSEPARLAVSTPGWSNGGDIAFEYTQYRDNRFPGLTWSTGPAGTKTYAIIMQDTDSGTGKPPFLHWTMYDIPAGTISLPAGMEPSGNPAGSHYGPNYKGKEQPYLGPRTPPGPKHHYYLQVFALDTSLPPDPNVTLDGLEGQMKGHVLASGETMGLGQADTGSH